VTFSVEENVVRFWQPSTSFFNSLFGGGGNAALASVGGVGHMKAFRDFSVGPPEPGIFPCFYKLKIKCTLINIYLKFDFSHTPCSCNQSSQLRMDLGTIGDAT
jgi:hypothetical protein